MPRPIARRTAAAALVVLGVVGLSAAAAAQLPLGTGSLQSGVASVAQCQPAGQVVGARLTSAFSGGEYRSTGVQLTNLATACLNKTYRVQIATAAGAPIDMNGAAAGTDLTGTLTSTTLSLTFPSTSTASIGRVAVVITG